MHDRPGLLVEPSGDGISIAILDADESWSATLNRDEANSLVEAMKQGVNYWLDDNDGARQIGFSNLIIYISAEFVVLGTKGTAQLVESIETFLGGF